MRGPVLVEFGASWCPHCQSLNAELPAVLEQYPAVKHLWIEDGKGMRLGRSFAVKLWPNLVFMHDGNVLQQLARPPLDAVKAAFEAMPR